MCIRDRYKVYRTDEEIEELKKEIEELEDYKGMQKDMDLSLIHIYQRR